MLCNDSGGIRRSVINCLCMILLAWSHTSLTAKSAIGACPDNYETCLLQWKTGRLASLKGPDGYLNLAGLYWLEEGDNTFGSDASNDLVFPQPADGFIGKFTQHNDQVTMTVEAGASVWNRDRKVHNIVMADDTSSDQTTIRHGDLAWTLIRRDDRFAVRLRDFQHPAVLSFSPIDSYPASQTYRVPARFRPYSEPRIVNVETVIPGLDYKPVSPGVVEFELGGESFALETYQAASELFIVFGDATNGRETYPAGRFIFTEMPEENGMLTLDFNTAHNPPCAFNDFATCPVASPRNRLRIRIAAGELYDTTLHP